MLKEYIAVLDTVPDFMVPTLVAHAVLGAHFVFKDNIEYDLWVNFSFRKVVIKVTQKEFNRILELPLVHIAHESTLDGDKSCLVVCPREEYPNVIKFARMWKPQ